MIEKWYLSVVLVQISLIMSKDENLLCFYASISISVGCFYSYPTPTFLLGFESFSNRSLRKVEKDFVGLGCDEEFCQNFAGC